MWSERGAKRGLKAVRGLHLIEVAPMTLGEDFVALLPVARAVPVDDAC